MRQNPKSPGSNRQGAAVVEFALVLPVFVFIMLMLIELSNLSMAKNVMLNEAREAVRLAISSNANYVDVETFSRDRVVKILNVRPSEVAFAITARSKMGVTRPSPATIVKGDYVTVRLDIPYSAIAIFAGGVTTENTIGQCTMQKE